MKAGLLAGFFATHVLQDVGFDGFGTVTYVCNPDEEIGSPFSGPVIRELAPAHDVALVLEGARANGDIVSSRKGITDFTITIEGKAAHAGVEPEKGRNAILQAHTGDDAPLWNVFAARGMGYLYIPILEYVKPGLERANITSGHSYLSAVITETRVARRAGT